MHKIPPHLQQLARLMQNKFTFSLYRYPLFTSFKQLLYLSTLFRTYKTPSITNNFFANTSEYTQPKLRNTGKMLKSWVVLINVYPRITPMRYWSKYILRNLQHVSIFHQFKLQQANNPPLFQKNSIICFADHLHNLFTK